MTDLKFYRILQRNVLRDKKDQVFFINEYLILFI